MNHGCADQQGLALDAPLEVGVKGWGCVHSTDQPWRFAAHVFG